MARQIIFHANTTENTQFSQSIERAPVKLDTLIPCFATRNRASLVLFSSVTVSLDLFISFQPHLHSIPIAMSNPADATPDWLVDDTVTIPTSRPSAVTPDVEDGTSWMVNESPTLAVNDDAIYTPSDTPKINAKKNKKSRDKKAKNNKNNDNSNIEAYVDDNVNNSGDNNISNAALASQKSWKQYFRESFERDGRLLLITIALLITMNIPVIHWALYPFTIFSTWIHEMCHGLAALMVGGSIDKLEIFRGGGGLAHLVLGASGQGFVSSAGYQGTAVVGFLLLIFRRTKRGPRTGTMFLACWMLLSCLIWIRNIFGFIFIFAFGLVLAGCAWMLPSFHIRNLYVILAMMTSMNAITTIRYLFAASHFVNGEKVQTDAHSMEEIVGGSYVVWATLWLIMAIALTILGIIFAIPGPDEVADFACCGVCQDMGCFKLFNYPGQRWCSRFFGRNNDDSPADNNNGSQEP